MAIKFHHINPLRYKHRVYCRHYANKRIGKSHHTYRRAECQFHIIVSQPNPGAFRVGTKSEINAIGAEGIFGQSKKHI